MESKENNYIERYWRDATPQDAIREPPMVARFKDDGDKYTGASEYGPSVLTGVDRTERGDVIRWFSSFNAFSFNHCQVYDAPDPGEGWRLIDVDTETPMIGDEIHDKWQNRWIIRSHDKPYDKELTYRRRIEQPKPKYIPFTWEDREQLRGRWIVDRDDRFEEVIDNVSKTPDGILYANGYRSDYLMSAWTFLDTNEPVGKRVQ